MATGPFAFLEYFARPTAPGFQFAPVMKAATDGKKRAEVFIYGDIGETFWGDGITAQTFVDELNAIDADELDVRINSPGGSAWDGLTMANAIIRHKATVTTHIDGLAASAASIIAVAGDEVVVSKYGQAMLHNGRAVVMGTAKDMREVADQLDGLNATMATYYADRAPKGGDAKAFARAMEAETWYNAEEMLAAGLATRIDESAVREEVEKAVASAMAGTTERYRYQGRTAAPAPIGLRATTTKEGHVADKKTLTESLGLPDDATEEQIIEATRKALAGDGTPAPADAPKDPPADPAPAPAAGDPTPPPTPAPEVVQPAASAASGVIQMDSAAYAALQAQALQGAQAHATLKAQAHAKVVDSAIDTGRITPARREHYMALMKADEADTTDLLTRRLQPGASVPLTEIGHSSDATPTALVTDNPLYKSLEEMTR